MQYPIHGVGLRVFDHVAVEIGDDDLVGGTGTFTSDVLVKTLIRAKNKIPADLSTNVHMFCCEEVKTALEIAALEKSSNAVKIVEAADQFRSLFFNIPIEVSDSISTTEAQIK